MTLEYFCPWSMGTSARYVGTTFEFNGLQSCIHISPVNELLTLSAHALEGYSSDFSVCLSVCENNIWELTPLQPLKYAPNGRRPYFIGFKCAGFLTSAAVSEKKRVKTWPIEIALRVTPPLKVHVLSRWLVGNAWAHIKDQLRPALLCEPLSLRASSNELTLLQPFCSFRKITVTRIQPRAHL